MSRYAFYPPGAGAGLSAAPAVLGQVGAGTAETTTGFSVTLTAAVPVGDTVIVAVKGSFGVGASATDSVGNTYTSDVASTGTGSTSILLHSTLTTALTTADHVTVTFTATNNGSVQLLHVAGALTLDRTASASNSGYATISATTSATTAPNELAVTTAGNGDVGASTWTPPAGWTQVPSGISNPNFIDTAHKTVPSDAAVTATWGSSVGATTNLSMVIATYRAS